MTVGATVAGGERLRLFCALTLPDDVLDALVRWQGEALGGGRIVSRENLHVTLAFLGHRPAGDVDVVAAELRAAAAGAESPEFDVCRYRETRSVGMLVLGDAEERATRLAVDLHGRLQRLGVYEPESRPWLPHLTVLRFRTPSRFRPPLPDLPPFSPSGAAVYMSRLRPGGAQYEILESVALGG
jgi:RNA 2',3'-cyclic 3'-phosphodiesterase